jgi:hypothetical protein
MFSFRQYPSIALVAVCIKDEKGWSGSGLIDFV